MPNHAARSRVWGRTVLRRFPAAREVARRFLYPDGYETRVQEAAVALVRRTDCAWDIGANEGLYARLFTAATDGLVVAVEPLPARIIDLAEIEGVEVVQAALGDRDGEGRLSVRGDAGTTSIISDGGEIAVRVMRADTLADRVGRPDVAKIDVEGYELDVLRGFGNLLDSVRAVIVEVHFARLAERNVRPRAVTDLLEAHGLSVRWLDPSHLVGSRS